MVDLKKRARPFGSSCSIVRESVAQKPLLSDVDRARTRRIVSSPCQNLQISRKTLHDVPAVQAEILPFHKLLEQVSEESTQLNRKEELEARRIRPSLSAKKVFEAELLRIIPSSASTAGHHRARADDTAVLPKCPLWSAPLSRPAQQKEHVGLCIDNHRKCFALQC